jgi:cobalt-zinc-cadmium efflux system outer membrane protein
MEDGGERWHIVCTTSTRMAGLRLAYLSLSAVWAVNTLSAAGALTLEGAINEALENNLGLLAQRYNLTIAKARLITAGLRPNPILSVGGDHLDLLGTGYNAVNSAGPAEYSIRTDFVFERGGKRQRRLEVAHEELGVARLELLDATRKIVLEVEGAFVDLQLAKENLDLARQNLRALTEIVEINELRLKSGDLAMVELIRSRVAALQFRNQVKQAELSVRKHGNALQFLLGRTRLDPAFDIAGEMRREEGPADASQLQRLALERRPDVGVLRREQARGQAELRLQLAQGKVDYVIGSEYRRQQGLAGTGNSVGLFFQTNLPLFNRNQGEIERVRREQRQLEARRRELEAAIILEVENAWQGFAAARALLEDIERDMLAQARDARNITEYSYRRGEATLIEFLDAQRAFNETMQAYQEARAEYARSLYVLDAATGRRGGTP